MRTTETIKLIFVVETAMLGHFCYVAVGTYYRDGYGRFREVARRGELGSHSVWLSEFLCFSV